MARFQREKHLGGSCVFIVRVVYLDSIIAVSLLENILDIWRQLVALCKQITTCGADLKNAKFGSVHLIELIFYSNLLFAFTLFA